MHIIEVIGNLAQHLPIAEPLKHERLIRNLTTQITRAANKPSVTQHDLRIAADRFKTNQKRANLDYTNKVRLAQARNKLRECRNIQSATPQTSFERLSS